MVRVMVWIPAKNAFMGFPFAVVATVASLTTVWLIPSQASEMPYGERCVILFVCFVESHLF